MKFRKRMGTWLIVSILTIPSVVLSETFSTLLLLPNQREETTTPSNNPIDLRTVPDVILHDSFANNAAGWQFVNSHTNQWRTGFPSTLLTAGEPNQGLYISDSEETFSYTRDTPAVSHAYKTIQLPENTADITISFDWFCEGYADTDWMLMTSDPMDYLRVWLVPSSYTPVADQAITAATSGGINIKNDNYIENWNILHENLTLHLGDLVGQEVKFIFEWTNGTVGWPTRPAAVRNLKIDAIPCRPITQFPFLENFSALSTTRTCWTIVNQNNDHRAWEYKQNYAQNEEDQRVVTDVAALYTLGTTGNNDDWLISPPLQLNGNQRLKYSYKVTEAGAPNAMQVKLATSGKEVSHFTHTLVPLQTYTNTQFKEKIVELRDANGNLLTGEIHLAWHVPSHEAEGKEIMITQVIVEDIPLCSPPSTFNQTPTEIQWEETPRAVAWEIVVQPSNTGIPTTSGIPCSEPKYNIAHLAPNTAFEYYVRSQCTTPTGAVVFSEWEGPMHLRTPLLPATLPFLESFENASDFGRVNDSINQWTIGNAISYGGDHALYIARNGAGANAYQINTRQVSHIYKDFSVPATVEDISIQFDWRNKGEENQDYFNVWLTPASFTPIAGRKIQPNTSEYIQLNSRPYHNSEHFQHEALLKNIRHLAGQNLRIIFEWINNDRNGNQPPAAIDNLAVSVQHCARPANLSYTAITQQTASLTWTAAPTVEHYELYVSTSPLPPTDNTAPTHRQVSNPHTLTDLAPNTRYFVWVRSSCTSDNKSFWIDPLTFTTLQIPASLPFQDNFESHAAWSTNRGAANEWYIGTGTANNSNQSIYISSDQGTTNSYDIEKESVAHIYRDIAIPTEAKELTIQYDWMSEGEISRNNPKDYFRLLQIPQDTLPVANTRLTGSTVIQVVGKTHHVHALGWENTTAILDVQAYQGQTIRLVFEWINDEKNGLQPPAAIDNFNAWISTCLSVKDMQAELVRHTANVRLSWTPQGEETKWDVYAIPQGDAAPTPATTGIRVEGEPTLLLENLTAGQFFEYYVRAICEEETSTNTSIWTGPAKFSYFLPSICVDLDGGVSDMPVSETNTYIVCQPGPVKKQLEARYTDVKTTDNYQVEAIEYAPPFPFYGGDLIDLTRDDYWSPTIDLGFDFCFYGNTYDKVLIGANGMITFSIEGEVEGGRYAPEGYSPWTFNERIPFNPEGNKAPFVNAIFGVMQDLAPSYSPEDYSVNYQILGAFPCRALVFNIYHMGLFFNAFDPSDVEGSTQTSQIVLYEGTNIIEVYVKNRPIADDLGWGAHNGSRGILGIQNEDGTRAHYPGMYPEDTVNRNTGAWTASNEAWRFTPSGESAVDFTWYKNGEVYATTEVIDVDITESVKYTAKASYRACEGGDLVIERTFNFLKRDLNLDQLTDWYLCGLSSDVNKAISLDKTTVQNYVISHLNDPKPDELTFEYYTDEDLTQLLPDVFAVTTQRKIYVKVSDPITSCSVVGSFEAIRLPPLALTTLPNTEACASYTLPLLKEGEQYFTATAGQGRAYQGGDVFTEIGESTLYIYKKDDRGCEAETSFKITLYSPIEADRLNDVRITCDEIFTLPPLSEGNKYYTAPQGGGIELLPGTEIIEPLTLYIQAKNGTKAIHCSDETSFSISFDDCPIPKGISPNGDGVNESFDLSNHGVSKLQIFNRHGIEVYAHGIGYSNQWKGQNKAGNRLPAATYYYVVISHGEQRTGWVQLNY